MVHHQHKKDCSECIELERQRLRVVRKKTQHVEAAHIPLRMRSASNPGNVGHDWVKRRFVERLEAPAGDRIFVPARLNENPYINREEYVKSLLNLDPVTRARILKGDWAARSSRGVLKREWFEVVDAPPADLSIVRYWDTAYQKKKTSDFTVGVKYALARNGVSFILHVARTQATPHEVETFIANIAGQDSRSIRIVLQQEPGSGSALWIGSMQRGALLGYSVYADQVKGSKFERSQPFRAAAEAGNVKLLRGEWNDEFLEAAPTNENMSTTTRSTPGVARSTTWRRIARSTRTYRYGRSDGGRRPGTNKIRLTTRRGATAALADDLDQEHGDRI